jgi:hypothetical protein
MKPTFSDNRRSIVNEHIQNVKQKALDGIKYILPHYIQETIKIERVIGGFGEAYITLTGVITDAIVNDDFSVELTVEYIHPATGETIVTKEPLSPH